MESGKGGAENRRASCHPSIVWCAMEVDSRIALWMTLVRIISFKKAYKLKRIPRFTSQELYHSASRKWGCQPSRNERETPGIQRNLPPLARRCPGNDNLPECTKFGVL